jgi:hypothetical protein
MGSVVELYLLQLESLLPRKQCADITAQIRAGIASAVEEREHELGRMLDDHETNAVLRTYGHPLAVAGRYLPMQQLVGPKVFPLYWYAIRAVLAVIASIGAIVAAIALLTDPRAIHAALQVLVRFFWIALDAGALVTVLFVLLDRPSVRPLFSEELDPRTRGAGFAGGRSAPLGAIARKDTVLELTTVAILALWWSGWLVFPSVVFSVKVELGSGITTMFFPVLAVCVADLLRLGVDFMLPYRTRRRVAAAIALNAAWLVLLVVAFSSPDLLQAAPSIEDPGEIARVVLIAERTFRAVLLGLGIWTASLLVADVARLLRR